MGILLNEEHYEHLDNLKCYDVHACATIIDLLQGVKEAWGDFIGTHVSETMFDIKKAWLKPHLEAHNNHFHPHIFRFHKGPDGHCYMQ